MSGSAGAPAGRLARVRDRLVELELDGLLLCHLPNIRYLTGFTGSSAWLLVTEGAAIFATDGRYEQQAEAQLARDGGFELMVSRDGVLDALAQRVGRDFTDQGIGFEGRHLAFADWNRLSKGGRSIEWKATTDAVEPLRAVKDDDELAAIQKAAEIAATALTEMLSLVEPGVREVDLAAELDFRMRRLGAEGSAFDTIVASGQRTALPHAETSTRQLEEGDLLLCDLGARWSGYCSDLTRTFVVGDPDPRQSDVYKTVLAAQREACEVLREGALGSAVDAAAREVFDRESLGAHFPHSTGHGLGLEVHEGPRLHRRSETELRSGMVVTVEPGLYFARWGGVRIEDAFVVGREEPRPLVDLAKDQLQGPPN